MAFFLLRDKNGVDFKIDKDASLKNDSSSIEFKIREYVFNLARILFT